MPRSQAVTQPMRRKTPHIVEEFFGYEPATDTTAARLTVVHLWSGLPYGPNPRKQRHAVSVAVITGPNVIVGQGRRPFINFKDAKERYEDFCGAIEAQPDVLCGAEVTPVMARQHLQDMTGQRFWHCHDCGDTLRIGALYCEACGKPTQGERTTAAQHAERVATTP